MAKFATTNVEVSAVKLEKDQYFQKRLARKGDYIVIINGYKYLFAKEVFEELFTPKVTSLQEHIELNGGETCQSV